MNRFQLGVLGIVVLAGCGSVSATSDGGAAGTHGGGGNGAGGAAGAAGTGDSGGTGAGGAVTGTAGAGSAGTGGAPGATSTGTGGGAGVPSSGNAGTGGSAGVHLGPNLVTNGDFSNGDTGWQTTSGSTVISATVASGEYCVSLSAALSIAAVGWPVSPSQPATLVAGNLYQLSFGVRTNVRMDATLFEDKVGQTVSPYTPDFDTGDAIAPGSQVITHTFTPAKDDLTAGVVFLLHDPAAGTMLCVDSVTLRQVLAN